MKQFYDEYMIESIDESGKKAVHFSYPDNFNYAYDVVDRIAGEEPDKRAIVYRGCYGDMKSFTFGDLVRYSNAVANELSDAGIGRGDKVMLIMKRRYEFWFVMLALHKLGATAVPTSHMVSHEDISYRVKAAGIKCVICADDDEICECVDEAEYNLRVDADTDKENDADTDREKKESGNGKKTKRILKYTVRTPRDGYSLLSLDAVDADRYTFARRETLATDIMLIYFTSGTSGEPKAVIHDYSYPLCHIITARDWHGVEENGLHFTVADSGWAKSVWGKMYGQWFLGCAVMIFDYEQFFANELLGVIADCKVTSFCAPPTIYKYLLREDLSSYDLSALKQVVTAGESMPVKLMDSFKEKTGLQIRCGFGQTETSLLTAVMKGETQRGDSIGKVSPQYDLRIVDDDGCEVAPGEIGEIVIYKDREKSPVGIFKGYFDDDELSDSVWDGNVYHSNDKAYMDGDGYIFFVSRADDVIKSSGYRVGPAEVEDVIMKHPAVFECAVTGYPSKSRGFIVKATVVLNDGYEPGTPLKVAIQDFVKARTANYKCPRMIEFVDELPKTVNGKINRAKIRERDMGKTEK